MSLTVCSEGADHIVATFGDHVLAVWTGQPTVRGAEQLERAVLKAVQMNRGRAAYFAILRRSLVMPESAVRSVYVRLGRKVGRDLGCIAVVVEGSGFRASGLRALVTGLGLAAAAKFPLRC